MGWFDAVVATPTRIVSSNNNNKSSRVKGSKGAAVIVATLTAAMVTATLTLQTRWVAQMGVCGSSRPRHDRQPTTSWEPFNTSNPHPSWCPNATCANSPTCLSCQRRFLLEIATGRSGSTSLMHMLGQLPGVRMGGENKHNTLYSLAELWDYTWRGNEAQYDAFQHEHVLDSGFACPAQHVVEYMYPPPLSHRESKTFQDADTVIGFKTIRFLGKRHGRGFASVQDAVALVKDLFPCTRVVVNIQSDTWRQAKSQQMWFETKGSLKNISQKLEHLNQEYQQVARLFGPHAVLVDASEWSADGGIAKINKLVQWLGFEDCRFEKLWHDNAEGSETDSSLRNVTLGPECRYVGT